LNTKSRNAEYTVHSHSALNQQIARKLKHELRTPINHIIGYSELILEETAELDAPYIGQLRALHAYGKSLAKVVDSSFAGGENDSEQSYVIILREAILPVLADARCSLNDLRESPLSTTYKSDLEKISEATSRLALLVQLSEEIR